MIKSKNKKNILIQLSSIFIVIVFFFSASFPVQAVYLEDPNAGANAPSIKEQAAAAAKVVLDPVGEALHAVVVLILKAILEFLGLLLSAAASILQWILKAENVHQTVGNPIVYDIWSKVRDVLNIAFILGLLFSAFCTVFQVSKFSYKNMLFNLILMALLVNFSFPIARIIIDFSNVIMYYLLNALDIGNFVTRITENNPLNGVVNQPSPSISYLIAAIIFTFIFAITLLVLAILFIIRLVALTFLVIFSPIAFVGSIIPFLSNKASSWWDSLFKYCFFGPVMIFMMYVAIEMIVKAKAFWQVSSSQIVNNQTNDPGIVAAIAFFSVPIVILWGGMGVAQSMSIAGAGEVTNRGKKAINWGAKNLSGYSLGKRGVKALGGKFEKGLAKTKYGKFLVPRVYKEAWKQRAAIKDREAFEGSTGQMHDLFNRVLSRGKEKTDYAFAAHQGKVSKYAKEISDVSTNADYVIQELERAIANKQLAKVEGALKVLAKDNNLNDMMHAIGKQYGDGTTISGPLHVKKAIKDMLSRAGAGANDDKNEFLAKQLMNISDIGVASGNIGFAGMGKFDKETGKFIVTSDEDQAGAAAAKFQNLEPQARQRLLHHNAVFGEDEKGNIADIDLVQQAILKKFNEKDLDQMNRSRDDLRRQFKKAEKGVDDDGNEAIKAEAKAIFDAIKAKNDKLATYADKVAKGLAK